jgi:hypothetical protein
MAKFAPPEENQAPGPGLTIWSFTSFPSGILLKSNRRINGFADAFSE